MQANVKCIFLIAVLALAGAVPSIRISAAPNPEVKSGVDKLYVIDCGDGSGPDESRWTPGVNVGIPSAFPATATSSTTPKGGSCGTRVLMML